MTEESSDWVLARANCTLEGMFEELRCTMEGDIKRFNSLPPPRRRRMMFDSNQVHSHKFEVYPVARNPAGDMIRINTNDSIFIQMTNILITAERSGVHAPLTITPKWNEESLTCDLVINGAVLSMSQISQKILGEFFLGTLHESDNQTRPRLPWSLSDVIPPQARSEGSPCWRNAGEVSQRLVASTAPNSSLQTKARCQR